MKESKSAPISEITLVVPEHTAYLSVVRQAVASAAGLMGFDATAILQLQMAIDEACINVIEHGSRGMGSSFIKLKLQPLPEKLVMHVHDRCERFSPLERELPDLNDYFNAPSQRGLGLVILRKFVDEIDHSYRANSGNKLCLTKYLPGRLPEGDRPAAPHS